MKRFVDRLARQKGIKPPRGYTKSGSVCRTFLDQHAPRKADNGAGVEVGSTPPNTAQIFLAERIEQEQGDALPDEAKTGAVVLSASTEADQGAERSTRSRKTGRRKQKSGVRKTLGKRSGSSADPSPPSQTSGTAIPLRIPFGNKEAALRLGARYRSGGWYAPPGVDLGAFRERGWL
jgi:DNA topoisomerase-3